MRIIMTALASAALIGAAATPAFAHHKTFHSIAQRSAAERSAPAASVPMHCPMQERTCAAPEGVGVVTAMTNAEVTIRHEPIACLNWPAMTMSFATQSPALLQGIAVGDQVRFELQAARDGYVVDQIVKQ